VNRRHLRLAIVVVMLLAVDSNSAQERDQTPRFASSVNTVSLNITVTDQSRECLTGFPAYWSSGWDGCPVKDLAEDAFHVSEDGVRQGITVFSRGDMPIAISLLIDVRSPAKARMSEVHEAALGMVQKLRGQDMAAVMSFENGVETYHPLTSSRTDLERAIRGTSSRALPSAPNLLSSLFRRREQPPSTVTTVRRHAIVFLTDGEASFEPGILLLAQRFDAAVYIVGLMGDQPLEESREPTLSMRRLANLTGGRAFFPTNGRRLRSVYNQIHHELSQQYTVGYVSTNTQNNGGWRNVTVEVDRPNTSTRTKQGYFAREP